MAVSSSNPNTTINHEVGKYKIAVGTTAVTMCLWLKYVSRSGNYACAFQINVGGSRGYRARISTRFDGHFEVCRPRDADGAYWGIQGYIFDAPFFPTNVFQLCTVTWNLTTDTAKCYINGVFKGSVIMGCPYSTFDTTYPNNITLFGRSPPLADPFIGSLEDARIYDRELSSAEIMDIFIKRGNDCNDAARDILTKTKPHLFL